MRKEREACIRGFGWTLNLYEPQVDMERKKKEEEQEPRNSHGLGGAGAGRLVHRVLFSMQGDGQKKGSDSSDSRTREGASRKV